MGSDFKLLMVAAMYENGGNTTHRFLDGHPQMFVYPFESQVGTKYVLDHMTSMFPFKYRWPVFDLAATAYQDYKAIIDEEVKVRSRTPNVSKFRHMPFEMDDDERCEIYQELIATTGRSRANNMAAFFKATFHAWKDHTRTGKEDFYVGYSPIISVDADKILNDLPHSHVLHIVRNPWSAYADTKKRPVPLSLEHYMMGWVLNQHAAVRFKAMFPERMHIVRAEDVMARPFETLGRICERLGLERTDSLRKPSWNGQSLKEVFPWGTIRTPTPEANRETAMELSGDERMEVKLLSAEFISHFQYESFLE